MTIRNLLFTFSLFSCLLASAQQANQRTYCENEAFNKKVHKVLSHTVTPISVEELHQHFDSHTLLDTRELDEYLVSHIPGAIHLGYDNPKFDVLDDLPKDTKIVLYCSIGYRSEKMGEKLEKQGFTNIKNLYGSIFEWANQDFPVVNPQKIETKRVHTYNKRWSKWVDNETVEKIY